MAQGDAGTCVICDSPNRLLIEKGRLNGASLESLEHLSGTSYKTVGRHFKNCNWNTKEQLEAIMEMNKKDEISLVHKTEMLQRKTAKDVARVAEENAPLDHEAVLEYLIKELMFLKNWAEDMSLEMKSNLDIDYNTKIKMLDGYRKIAVSMADTYTSFQRLKNEDKVIEASADMKAIREQILGKIKEIGPPVIDAEIVE